MKGRKPLANPEIRFKVLDLIEIFGIKELAEKLKVHLSTAYRWSSYSYSVYPNDFHKRRMLRLWYYYKRNHRGDRGNATQAGTNELNPDKMTEKTGVIHA